jgi:hypothetical protein
MVVMAASMKMTVFWRVALRSMVEIDQRFRDAYSFHQSSDLPIMEATDITKRRSISTTIQFVLGGLVVTALAIVPEFRGFKPYRGRWIFKGHKNRSTTSFGGEVKSSVACRKMLWHIKGPWRIFLYLFPARCLWWYLPKSASGWLRND